MSILGLLKIIFIDDNKNRGIQQKSRRSNHSSRYIKVKHNCHEKKYRVNKYGEVFED